MDTLGSFYRYSWFWKAKYFDWKSVFWGDRSKNHRSTDQNRADNYSQDFFSKFRSNKLWLLKSLSGGGWHEVQIVRRGKSVTLVVDKIENSADIPGGSGSGWFLFTVFRSEFIISFRYDANGENGDWSCRWSCKF